VFFKVRLTCYDIVIVCQPLQRRPDSGVVGSLVQRMTENYVKIVKKLKTSLSDCVQESNRERKKISTSVDNRWFISESPIENHPQSSGNHLARLGFYTFLCKSLHELAVGI